MSKVVFRGAVLPLAVLALSMGVFALPGAGRAAEPSLEAARLDCYTHADGTNYFGLAVKPSAAPSAGGRDLVVLFDTSASQAGQYRSDALASLGDLLAQLGPEDRVRLIAVDLHAIPMNEGFVTPDGPELEKALEKLNRREPLGSTDMEKALSAAVESFGPASQNDRAAVYLGDGMSTAQLLGTEEFKNLTGRLLDARLPVNSCPIGPKVDQQLLGALAANTGGRTIELGEQAGQELADAVHAIVYWPGEATIENGELHPERFPPLRSDRASVLVGKLDGKGPIDLDVTVTGPGGPQKLNLTAPLAASNEDNAYLVELFGRAKADGGVSLPLVGAESLIAARDEINLGVMSLTEMAEQALASGSLDHAAKLADAALEAERTDLLFNHRKLGMIHGRYTSLVNWGDAVFERLRLPVPDKIHEDELVNTDLSQYDTLYVPGGGGLRLSDEAAEALREYIRGGGGYVGICGGATTASKYGLIEATKYKFNVRGPVWNKLQEHPITEGYDLKRMVLFPHASGPLYVIEEGQEDHVPVAIFDVGNPPLPTFVNTIARRMGEGRIVTFSGHPESSAETNLLMRNAFLWTTKILEPEEE